MLLYKEEGNGEHPRLFFERNTHDCVFVLEIFNFICYTYVLFKIKTIYAHDDYYVQTWFAVPDDPINESFT
jgi:hypothetical protein